MTYDCDLSGCIDEYLIYIALPALPVGVIALILYTIHCRIVRAKSAAENEQNDEYDFVIDNTVYDTVKFEKDHDTTNNTTKISSETTTSTTTTTTLEAGLTENQYANPELSFEIYNTDYEEVSPEIDNESTKDDFVLYNDEYDVSANYQSLSNEEDYEEDFYEELDIADYESAADNERDIAKNTATTAQTQGDSVINQNDHIR